MISVVIPTLDPGAELALTLAALVPAAVDDVVREVIIVDGGSTDGTEALAEAAGARFIRAPRGRGAQLAAGARAARHPWLLFLHADTVLEDGWQQAVAAHLLAGHDADGDRAAVFRFALADQGWRPRLIELGVALRASWLALPYGDQGLLISRALYDEVGGHRDMALFEDVEIIRRLGRHRLRHLAPCAVTSARRYRTCGYARRVVRNWWCLALYALGRPIDDIARIYDG